MAMGDDIGIKCITGLELINQKRYYSNWPLKQKLKRPKAREIIIGAIRAVKIICLGEAGAVIYKIFTRLPFVSRTPAIKRFDIPYIQRK